MTKENEVQIWLTTDELAERLRLKTQTVHGWRKKGKGPRWVKLDGIVRYKMKDVEAYEAGL